MTARRSSFGCAALTCAVLFCCVSCVRSAWADEDSLKSSIGRYAKKADWTGAWIWSATSDGKIDANARRVYLRKRIDVYERATSAVVYCTAVSQYRLYLNGVFAACLGSIALRKGAGRRGVPTRSVWSRT